jgi:acyl-coenzyme A synthetase/AMP-(fatty) acid ligase
MLGSKFFIEKVSPLMRNARNFDVFSYDLLVKFSTTAYFRNEYIKKYEKVKRPTSAKLSYAVSEANKFKLINSTLGEKIDEMARQRPNDVCYNFCLNQIAFTYAELKQRVDELAQSLLDLGFSKGDRLALLLPNVPELNLTILAAAKIGIIVVLMNPAYQLVEIEYMLKKTNAKGVIILDNLKTLKHYEILCQICPELATNINDELNSSALPSLKHVIVAHNGLVNDSNISYKGTRKFAELEKYKLPTQRPLPCIDTDDHFAILFTVRLYIIF